MSDKETPLDKLNAAIKDSWEKNGGNPANYEARRLHEQGFLDGMQYALQPKADKTETMPDSVDPNFYRDVLIGLFAPNDYDNPTVRAEFDKAFEELKERVKNGTDNITLD